MKYEYLDKDGAIFRVKAGEWPFRSADLYDPQNKKWVPYKGSLSALSREGTPVSESELGIEPDAQA